MIRDKEAAEGTASSGRTPRRDKCHATQRVRNSNRGLYDPDFADSMVIKLRGANLLSRLDLGNAMRTMNRQDQDRFKFQKFCVLAIGNFLEAQCQDLFEGLREEQKLCQDQAKKKKVAQMRSLLVESIDGRRQVQVDAPTVQR